MNEGPRFPNPLIRAKLSRPNEKTFISRLGQVLSTRRKKAKCENPQYPAVAENHRWDPIDRKSNITSTGRSPRISITQERLAIASSTVRLFAILLGTNARRRGTRSAMDWPFSHLSIQKRVFSPLPTTKPTANLRKVWTCPGTWTGSSPRVC